MNNMVVKYQVRPTNYSLLNEFLVLLNGGTCSHLDKGRYFERENGEKKNLLQISRS